MERGFSVSGSRAWGADPRDNILLQLNRYGAVWRPAGDGIVFGQQRVVEIARTLDEPAVGLSLNRITELDTRPASQPPICPLVRAIGSSNTMPGSAINPDASGQYRHPIAHPYDQPDDMLDHDQRDAALIANTAQSATAWD
jgi:hypothetical protein